MKLETIKVGDPLLVRWLKVGASKPTAMRVDVLRIAVAVAELYVESNDERHGESCGIRRWIQVRAVLRRPAACWRPALDHRDDDFPARSGVAPMSNVPGCSVSELERMIDADVEVVRTLALLAARRMKAQAVELERGLSDLPVARTGEALYRLLDSASAEAFLRCSSLADLKARAFCEAGRRSMFVSAVAAAARLEIELRHERERSAAEARMAEAEAASFRRQVGEPDALAPSPVAPPAGR